MKKLLLILLAALCAAAAHAANDVVITLDEGQPSAKARITEINLSTNEVKFERLDAEGVKLPGTTVFAKALSGNLTEPPSLAQLKTAIQAAE